MTSMKRRNPIKEKAQISIMCKLAMSMRYSEVIVEAVQIFYGNRTFLWTVDLIVRFIPSNMFKQSSESQGLGCPAME